MVTSSGQLNSRNLSLSSVSSHLPYRLPASHLNFSSHCRPHPARIVAGGFMDQVMTGKNDYSLLTGHQNQLSKYPPPPNPSAPNAPLPVPSDISKPHQPVPIDLPVSRDYFNLSTQNINLIPPHSPSYQSKRQWIQTTFTVLTTIAISYLLAPLATATMFLLSNQTKRVNGTDMLTKS